MKLSVTLVFCALLTAVSSAAIAKEGSVELADTADSVVGVVDILHPVEKREVPNAVYNNLVWYYQYASSAYADSCPRPNGNTFVKWVNNAATDTQSFIAIDDTRKEFIVAFRGSSSNYDFLTDVRGLSTEFDASGIKGPKGVRVHRGFLKAWTSISVEVGETLASLYAAGPQYSSYSIVSTGHSLGGALASLAGITLKNQLPNAAVRIYTYGQPRTGNEAYANWVNNAIGLAQLARSVNANDPVPHVPSRFLGYLHHGTEYWTKSPPSAASTIICPQNDDPNCSAGTWSTILDIPKKPHRSYFGIKNGTPYC
ncbi:Alpha/Beta hydrolase protein [Collybia nuda]|uniref:Alpha/Beta hydrolase protein n=1 Tax=Collybia nuda TaxID=64659 RepID=A0A9P5Y358_9AGAR|nr:Alpha/Beta hydrolase protein [Collybia nuda]